MLLVFWEHAGALLFHPTRRINNLYHDWLRRADGGLSLLFFSPYEHHEGGGGQKVPKIRVVLIIPIMVLC